MRGEFGEFVELLPAQQRIQEQWYAGTADAIYQNIDIIRNHAPDYVLILAGDHIYKMDYGPMIAAHVDSKADITVGCIEVESIQGSDKPYLASMGIYVFNAKFLYDLLIEDADNVESAHDFGKDVVPKIVENYEAYAYPFRDAQSNSIAYWRDVGTVDAFWQANLELIGITPELNLYDEDWPIWTYQEQLPPAKFVFDDENRRGMAVDSMVSGGCIISGSVVRHSLLFSNVHVDSFAEVEDSVILPDVEIGRNCKIKRTIIDRGCKIPDDMEIGIDPDKDRDQFFVSPGGVVLVIPEMLGQELHHVR